MLAHWNHSPRVDMLLHTDTLSWICIKQSLILLFNAVCLEAANTNFIDLGLTRPEFELTISHTRGEHANNFIKDAVMIGWPKVNDLTQNIVRC
jgi:hypothetical protein